MSLDVYPPTVTPVSISSANTDAFGRYRVSNPETLFDSKQLHDSQPLFWDDSQVSGGSTTSTHSTAKASTTIAVAATTAGKRVRQTFMRFNYQPGKSQLILLTGQLEDISGTTGITAAMGLFDDDNGIFVKMTPSGISLNIRTSTTGSAVDTSVAQASWNGDKLDGTGASGVTLDKTKTQIFWIDMEWLGVGSVRCGFVVDGQFILCHTFHHANSYLNTAGTPEAVVYMSTPNLPLRYEIENDGTGAATTMQHICSTVISEGGSQQLGYDRWITPGTTSVSASTDGTIYAVMAIKLKTTHLDAAVSIANIDILETSGSDTWQWLLLRDPSIATGSLSYSNLTNGSVQYAIGGATITAGTGLELGGGFGASANKGGASLATVDNAMRLGSQIDGTPQEFVLCVRPVSSTGATIYGGITIREIT